jgi:hypothetical protein
MSKHLNITQTCISMNEIVNCVAYAEVMHNAMTTQQLQN